MYVFRYEAGQWSVTQKLAPVDPGDGDWFGQWIALTGDLAVIGAPDDGAWLEPSPCVPPESTLRRVVAPVLRS